MPGAIQQKQQRLKPIQNEVKKETPLEKEKQTLISKYLKKNNQRPPYWEKLEALIRTCENRHNLNVIKEIPVGSLLLDFLLPAIFFQQNRHLICVIFVPSSPRTDLSFSNTFVFVGILRKM